MKKTALLIDGGWFAKGLGDILKLTGGWPSAVQVLANAQTILQDSGDTDMIPAIKLARREGIQVFVVKLDPWDIKHNLIEDSDGVRVLTPKP